LKAHVLSPERDWGTTPDEDKLNDELIVPVPGLTPSSRWEVETAEKGLSDEPFPANPSSKSPQIQLSCSKNTWKILKINTLKQQ
jgi:hypothetical protein